MELLHTADMQHSAQPLVTSPAAANTQPRARRLPDGGMQGLPAPTLKSTVVQRLEDEIVSGLLQPGTRLDEVQLSERYGLSRTPLREAFAQIAASGLIEIRPRSGAYVTQLSSHAMLELLAFTAEIEAIAASWAATRMTMQEQAHMSNLQNEAQAVVASGNADAYFELNRQFHEAIYAGAHNTYVHTCAHKLFQQGAPFRRLQLRQHGRLETSHAEHGRIAEAIMAQDGPAAATAIRSHIMIQGDRFLEFLAALPDGYVASGRR
jgi:DNA-binding GntR family transcriptional regulator